MSLDEVMLLHRLARAYGVQTMHRDGFARPVIPAPENILAILRILGAPVERLNDVQPALRERRLFSWRRAIEPILIAWDGLPFTIKLRLPAKLATSSIAYRITLENGEAMDGIFDNNSGKGASHSIEGEEFVERQLTIRSALSIGYHRLYLTTAKQAFQALLICAPEQSHDALAALHKPWGIFAPTYALEDRATWGAGDLFGLQSFAEFSARAGAKLIGTLPMLATFLDEPFDPSPYAAVSRLFWNEFYLAVERIPELDYCPAARTLINAHDFRDEIAALRAAPLIDYRRVMALKRRALEALLDCLLEQSSERRSAFERYVESHPSVRDYAAFRAKVEHERTTWPHWEAAARTGNLANTTNGDPARNYHLFVQWLTEQQMNQLKAQTDTSGVALYLDFPLGVNRDGYDVWRNQDLFALSASAGAPPDSLFVGGQNWGFPPFHPEAIRQQDYRYYIDCLRHTLRYANLLRIDHVMGLHRMYWIASGAGATDGVYVHYKADEFYAVLSLESHRHGGQIVGENLGTVPEYANDALRRHRIFGLHVGQFGVAVGTQPTLSEVPPENIASLNTHDMPTFAGFWTGKDIQDRFDLGLLDEAQVAQETAHRAAQRAALVDFLRRQKLLAPDSEDPSDVLRAWLCFIAGHGADLLLINLEDLWLETLPQNVPGTWRERPNWQRKTRHSIPALQEIAAVMNILAAVNQIRTKTGQMAQAQAEQVN